jgi:uncharacterized membrane protein YhaH (DUF805 family)
MKWFIHCFKNYAKFSGRASRAEYWWFWLVLTGGEVVCRIAIAVIPSLGALVTAAFQLAVIVPHLAVGSRRLHDAGHSAWWLVPPIVLFTPIVAFKSRLVASEPIAAVPLLIVAGSSALLVLIFLLQPGDPGHNRYGDAAPSTPD